ncbi:hypothetical protein PPL_08129 [Heterostelium album PN500]|uniref:Uncharacterized protein n=1 Tax=Heterostelium pallidum (strain ATCC 26659 / Pp 5 / PN500) TaxID=670386 RepID=D3BIP6_HETP5|nr:hypothetical protein PPL_08129 [Heterostelium album PN500]EFA78670.1 hypothetical protein PPL_08129 [Heterostelium album PN500]|eukprot:XP_020430794.1 hypothetical protein PPL_08129 [Heterostelium album PN500]
MEPKIGYDNIEQKGSINDVNTDYRISIILSIKNITLVSDEFYMSCLTAVLYCKLINYMFHDLTYDYSYLHIIHDLFIFIMVYCPLLHRSNGYALTFY